ncbi:hypothetical protein BDV93DRAFT_566515 [Ceratobasidium sp. AG-I]|nr:hypothetical protein BDV93DRAFT_566515 [Ceratobasidium sp. AG-I]
MSSQMPSFSTANPSPPDVVRSSAPAPATSRLQTAALTQDIVALKMRTKCIEDRAHVLETTIQTLQERDEHSNEKIKALTLNLELVEARCERLDRQLSVLLQSVGVELKTSPAPELPTLAGPAIVSESQVKAESSTVNSDPSADIRKIVAAALSSLYGVTKFTMKAYGHYPTVSKMHMDWPSRMNGDVRVPLHRFDFSEAHGSSKNSDTYESWVQLSLSQGPNLANVTHLSSKELNRKSVMAECGKLYSSLKAQHKRLVQKHAAPAIGIKRKVEAVDGEEATLVAQGDSLGDIPSDFSYTEFLQSNSFSVEVPPRSDELLAPFLAPTEVFHAAPDVGVSDKVSAPITTPQVTPKNHPDAIRSRKVVKCNMRTRKRPYLTGNSAKFKLPKYDSFYTAGAMSEEEEVIDSVDQDGQVTASHFEAHAYEWASEELVAIREATDSIPDPTTSNKTPRRRGTTKSGPPHTNTSVDGGIRTWMIKPSVLAKHPQWLTESLVYSSGTEWNEPEPVDARGARKVAKRIRTIAVPGLELVHQADANVLRVQAKIEEFNNSREL